MRPDQLSEMQLDALRESGSIGAGHAATAMSQLVDHAVDIDVPKVEIIPIGRVPDLFGGPETLVAAVYSRIVGDIGGSMLFLAARGPSLLLVDMLRNRPVGSTRSFGKDEEALFTHSVSLLVSAYLAAVSRFTDLNALPARPAFSFDMAAAILEVVTAEAGLEADTALVLRTRFHDQETAVDAYLLFMPDSASLDTILARLGVV
jgi:chemotaxis protein CheC